jgi:hypothetical protein
MLFWDFLLVSIFFQTVNAVAKMLIFSSCSLLDQYESYDGLKPQANDKVTYSKLVNNNPKIIISCSPLKKKKNTSDGRLGTAFYQIGDAIEPLFEIFLDEVNGGRQPLLHFWR